MSSCALMLLVLLASNCHTKGETTFSVLARERNGTQTSTGQENSRRQSEVKYESIASPILAITLTASEVAGVSRSTTEDQGAAGNNGSSVEKASTLVDRGKRSSVIFDDVVYDFITTKTPPFPEPSFCLTKGAELVHNASILLSGTDFNLARKLVSTYNMVLICSTKVIQSRDVLVDVLTDMDVAFDRFYVAPSPSVSYVYRSFDGFTTAVIGHLTEKSDVPLYGVQFPRGFRKKPAIFAAIDTKALMDMKPQFALYFTCSALLKRNRFVFVVYPLEMSSYPCSMPNGSGENYRQIDIYVDSGNEVNTDENRDAPDCGTTLNDCVRTATKTDKSQESANCKTEVNVYLRPTKTGTKVGCVWWDETAGGWSSDRCSVRLDAESWMVYCSCNLTGRSVTRVVLYERK